MSLSRLFPFSTVQFACAVLEVEHWSHTDVVVGEQFVPLLTDDCPLLVPMTKTAVFDLGLASQPSAKVCVGARSEAPVIAKICTIAAVRCVLRGQQAFRSQRCVKLIILPESGLVVPCCRGKSRIFVCKRFKVICECECVCLSSILARVLAHAAPNPTLLAQRSQ